MQWRSFRERSNFPQIWFQDLSSLEFEVSKSSMWKHTTLCDKGVFSFTILTTLTTNWAQIFGGSLFYAYVEIHQVRRLVFVNYQQCPESLRTTELHANHHAWFFTKCFPDSHNGISQNFHRFVTSCTSLITQNMDTVWEYFYTINIFTK